MSLEELNTPVEQSSTYRVSALLKGFVRMWRGEVPALFAILVNMAVQGVLMYLDVQSGFSIGFIASLLVSALSAMWLYAWLSATALQSVVGHPSMSTVRAQVSDNLANFSLWAGVQWLLILLLALITPGLVIVAAILTPFLPLAAIDGKRNALAANFSAIKEKFGRWLITCFVLVILGQILFLLSALNTFFIKGTPAALIFWLAIGIVAWWILTAWSLIYRQTDVSASTDADA